MIAVTGTALTGPLCLCPHTSLQGYACYSYGYNKPGTKPASSQSRKPWLGYCPQSAKRDSNPNLFTQQRIQTPLGMSKPDLTNGTGKETALNSSTVKGKHPRCTDAKEKLSIIPYKKKTPFLFLLYRSWTNGKQTIQPLMTSPTGQMLP
ncbi:Hypothetical predicted protein [Pelobates cultripes]|uniref:Uncharacterized protein n=1 Tax=Pelobates cultripes TaxID=61616 RepID=A0AAD1VW27_PELCU|nr:Hypothetical predicted protein [Pelobates cultripes]